MKAFELFVIGVCILLGIFVLLAFIIFVIFVILMPLGLIHIFNGNAVGIGPLNDLWMCIPSWGACF